MLVHTLILGVFVIYIQQGRLILMTGLVLIGLLLAGLAGLVGCRTSDSVGGGESVVLSDAGGDVDDVVNAGSEVEDSDGQVVTGAKWGSDAVRVRQGAAMRRARQTVKQAIAEIDRPDYLPTIVGDEVLVRPVAEEDDPEPSLASQRAYVKGRDAYLQGKRSIPEAIRLLDQSLRLVPDQPDVLRLLGQAYLAYGNATRGAHYLRQVVKLNPRDVEAVFGLGQIEFHQGRWSEASAVLAHGLSLTDELAGTDQGTALLMRFYLGGALERQGYDGAAIELYLGYLNSSSRISRTTRLARDLYVLGRQHALIWQSVGDAYHRLKRPADALDAYQRARKAEGGAGEAFGLTQRMVYTLVKLGHKRESEDLVIGLIRDDPHSAAVLGLLRGLSLGGTASKRLAEAIEPIYIEKNKPAGLALALSDLLDSRDGLGLLENHLEAKPADRVVFERLIHRRFEGVDEAKRVDVAVEGLRLLKRMTGEAPAVSEVYSQIVLRAIGDESVLLAAFDKLGEDEANVPVLRMMRGMALERAGRWTEAIVELETAMGQVNFGEAEVLVSETNRDDGGRLPEGEASVVEFEAARVALARLLAKQGEVKKALALLEPLSDRMDAQVVHLRVQLLMATGRLDDAVVLLDKMIGVQPRHVGLTLQKAGLQIAQGHVLEAEQTLQDALNRMPKAEPIYERLFMLYDKNVLPDSVRQYQKLMVRLLGTIPKSRLARLQNARLIGQRDWGQAEVILKGLLAANPEDFEVLDELLDVYVRSDRAGEAEKLLDERLADPKVKRVMLTVALQHYRQRVPDQGKFNRVMERFLKGEAVGVVRNEQLAQLYLRMDRAQEALDLIEKTLSGEIDKPELLSELASGLGKAMEALEYPQAKIDLRMEALVEQFPDEEADIRFEWARLVERLDGERGMQMMIELLNDFPDHAMTNNNLGYNLANQGVRLDEAEGMIQRAVSAEPMNAAYLDSLGWVYYKQGRFEKSVMTLTQARQAKGGVNPVILDHLGDALYRLGRREEAVGVWRDAQRLLLRLSPELLAVDPEMAVVTPRLQAKMQAIKGDGRPPVAESPGAVEVGADEVLPDENLDGTGGEDFEDGGVEVLGAVSGVILEGVSAGDAADSGGGDGGGIGEGDSEE